MLGTQNIKSDHRATREIISQLFLHWQSSIAPTQKFEVWRLVWFINTSEQIRRMQDVIHWHMNVHDWQQVCHCSVRQAVAYCECRNKCVWLRCHYPHTFIQHIFLNTTICRPYINNVWPSWSVNMHKQDKTTCCWYTVGYIKNLPFLNTIKQLNATLNPVLTEL